MNKTLKMTPINAAEIARGYLVKNLSYEQYHMVDSRFTDELYRLVYTARDYYDRQVEIAVTIDLLFKTISADIALRKDELESYLDLAMWK